MGHGPSQRPISTPNGIGQPNNEEPWISRVQCLQSPTTDAKHHFEHDESMTAKKIMGIMIGATGNGLFERRQPVMVPRCKGSRANQAIPELAMHVQTLLRGLGSLWQSLNANLKVLQNCSRSRWCSTGGCRMTYPPGFEGLGHGVVLGMPQTGFSEALEQHGDCHKCSFVVVGVLA